MIEVSPATVHRVLSRANVMRRWNSKASKKGNGFEQPLSPHEHWHVDISYLNIAGTFYYFFGVIDGYSRYIVHWEIRESMTERDASIILTRAREKFPDTNARIITDNGSQFVAKEFKEFVRLNGMTQVRTSPYYPQSNGKIERFNRTYKNSCIRPKTPLSKEDAEKETAGFVEYYNNKRLHSAIGYVTPAVKLAGLEKEIFAERDRKLVKARAQRKLNNQKRKSA